jgi:hypothetical protein
MFIRAIQTGVQTLDPEVAYFFPTTFQFDEWKIRELNNQRMENILEENPEDNNKENNHEVSRHQIKWTNVIYRDENGNISGRAYIPLKDDEDQNSEWGNYEIEENMNNGSPIAATHNLNTVDGNEVSQSPTISEILLTDEEMRSYITDPAKCRVTVLRTFLVRKGIDGQKTRKLIHYYSNTPCRNRRS